MFSQGSKIFRGIGIAWFILANLFSMICVSAHAESLPTGFVYLRQVAPSIIQNMRYSGNHNFVGRPIAGYQAPLCILTEEAALALAKVQAELAQSSLSLKVFDCYRPQMAVEDFYSWSQQAGQIHMREEFYPNTDKKDLFNLGYIARRSGHSRGSTVDLTVVPIGVSAQHYVTGQTLVACTEFKNKRFGDGSLDFGTGYDCMDERSHIDNADVPLVAQSNRQMLRTIMEKYGFKIYEKEWWHFTLEEEPFPETYFNFAVK